MDLAYMNALPQTGGFDYSNCLRNKALNHAKGNGLKTNITTAKTGTTICGLVFNVSASPKINSFESAKTKWMETLTNNWHLIGWCCLGC